MLFTGPQVAQLVGMSYAKLAFYARSGLLVPSVNGAAGAHRRYVFADVVAAYVLAILKPGVGAARGRDQALARLAKCIQHLGSRALSRPGASLPPLFLDESLERPEDERDPDPRTGGALIVVVDVDAAAREMRARASPARRATSKIMLTQSPRRAG
jgi:hypothetical protein